VLARIFRKTNVNTGRRMFRRAKTAETEPA
jgi:hypothetical protein